MPLFRPHLQTYSLPNDAEGYADMSITDDMVSDVYLEFNQRTRQEESVNNLGTLTGVTISMDHTFKAASKAIIVTPDNKHVRVMKGGLLTILNEESENLTWRLCQTQSPVEITEALDGLRQRYQTLGISLPISATADNCCHIRSAILKALPETRVLLDVFHFIARYTVTVLNGSKNPHRGEVAQDIRDAIIKKGAQKGASATYWSRRDQVIRLEAAYKKWSLFGGVWSAAAAKVSGQACHLLIMSFTKVFQRYTRSNFGMFRKGV
ncbi:hypothetical protein QCA50_017787 [Cerrena zonata]|uniref:Transposase n=1 Tax=Cerrena zonata TaxID=2478898 RepID=A0AAW0FLY0_9APHY